MLLPPARLEPCHNVNDFESGVAGLDEWLKRRARSNQASGASRTYVVTDPENRVAGYYALASGGLALAEASGRIRRNMPDPIPMAVLGRLAVAKALQGRGLGAAMLQDAVLRVRQAAAILGIRGILVHAISEDARRFYEHHGFITAPRASMTLILPLAD